ncbi:MAG: hypothetical protein RIE55_00425, partial [Marinoscillum sp.]
NKQFIMAAIAYNLKKYLKFEQKRTQSAVRELRQTLHSRTLEFILLFKAIIRSGKALQPH